MSKYWLEFWSFSSFRASLRASLEILEELRQLTGSANASFPAIAAAEISGKSYGVELMQVDRWWMQRYSIPPPSLFVTANRGYEPQT